jgi:ribulose-phosphate 3-epimerase
MAEGDFLFRDIGTVQFEIDLMVARPYLHALDWAMTGASRIIFHIESLEDDGAIFDELPKDGLKEIGLAINIDTPNEAVEPHIHKIDFVQCMGIAKIGYQGQAFDERVFAKLSDFRSRFPELVLSVDGGVNMETAPLLVNAGANRLASGSLIWESSDIIETIKQLQQL